jgi:hypothetical protein
VDWVAADDRQAARAGCLVRTTLRISWSAPAPDYRLLDAPKPFNGRSKKEISKAPESDVSIRTSKSPTATILPARESDRQTMLPSNADVNQRRGDQCRDDRSGNCLFGISDLLGQRRNPAVTGVGDEHESAGMEEI